MGYWWNIFMVLCSNCGSENVGNARFCINCGQKLEKNEVKSKICPECGVENPIDAKFCMECGNNLESTQNIQSKPFNPTGTLNDFKSDLELLDKFKDEISELIDSKTINVPRDENAEYKINLQVKEVEDEINTRKKDLDSKLKVLNSNLIIIGLKKDEKDPYKFTFQINLDQEELNRYVEFYRNEKNKSVKNNQNNLNSDQNSHVLDVCPICKFSQLAFNVHKGALGLTTIKTLECSNCGAVFEEKGRKYKLDKIIDTSQPIWKKYHKQTLKDVEWIRIGNGGVSDDEQRKIDLQNKERERKEVEALKKSDINQFLTGLQNGEIGLNTAESSPIMLKKNETLSMVLHNISMLEPRSVRYTVGGYAGPSIRVAKGLSFRVGSIAAHSESHEELRNIDKGSLVLSNKRLIFLGSKRTTNIDLHKIVAIEAYKDGIESQRENKQKAEYFIGTDKSNITFTIEGRSSTIPVNGVVLKAAIQGNIAHL